MKAMLLEQPRLVEARPLAQREIPVPEPGPGEILIRVTACGVCHTDLHTVEGDLRLPRLPIVPGHQVVGRVVGSARDAVKFTANERVGVTWLFSSCGSCTFCLGGRENLCAAARFTGFHENGGYEEYMVVPESSAFPIPPSFSDVEATPLLCGGVIGYRALEMTEIKPGGKLGLYGFGNSAHVVIQVAVSRGLQVEVFTRSKNHQELAMQLGAKRVGAPDEAPSEPLDAAIIFAPAGSIVPLSLKALGRGGVLVLAGITMSEIPPLDYQLIYWERSVRSVANTTRSDAEKLLKEAAQIPVKTVVETFPLEDANRVLEMMKESRLRGGAALLV